MRYSMFVAAILGSSVLFGCPQQPSGGGRLTVDILPASVCEAGGAWSIDGGNWLSSGTTVGGLSAGIHTVAFHPVAGWAHPGNQSVAIVVNQPAAITGTYTSLAETGVVMISIEPEAARLASARWRLDAGAWHLSGESALGVPVGTHIVSFSEAVGRPGWIKPSNITVEVDIDPTVTEMGTYTPLLASNEWVVFGYNDLGMHCMNESFSDLMILPPYNTLHALVVDRSGPKPRIVQDGISVSYAFPSNTSSSNKTDFWTYAQDLFELDDPLPPDTGLTGNGLAGAMQSLAADGRSDWDATGIPLTPLLDDMTENPLQLAVISVAKAGTDVVQTQAVAPVSWDIECSRCHNTPGMTPTEDILAAHDRLHGTTIGFDSRKPVVCGRCHPQPELGLTGDMGMATLSSSMHTAHARRLWRLGDTLENTCYACHPGGTTQCLRDVHHLAGMICVDCHGTMDDVGNPARQPWTDEPRCDSCHHRAGFEFEQDSTLFRNSKGHGGIHCAACHGAPHAITPTANPEDNVQSIAIQGREGPISDCTVCHSDDTANASFAHKYIAPAGV